METDNENRSINTYKETSYEQFKSYDRFRFLQQYMSRALAEAESLLDVGCAKGELIYFLKEIYPQIRYVGLEYAPELIERAKQEPKLEGVRFVQGDARSFSLKEQFDITVMSGVLSIFDEIEAPLRCMLQHTKSSGSGFIFGGFNSHDIDVIVRFRNNKKEDASWESGWNMFSLETVKDALQPYVSSIDIQRFELSVDLPPSDNPEKSYTLRTEEKGRIILTGGNVIREFYLVIFRKR